VSSLAIANAFSGYVLLLRGQPAAAVPYLERGLAISEDQDFVHGVCANAVYLGWAAALSGDHGRAIELVERGIEQRAGGAVMQWTRYGTVTARVYLAAGRLAPARQALAEGAQAARERQARGYRAPLLRLEAEALLCGGEAPLARQRAEEALAVATELEAEPEIAHVHATLARILTALGDLAAARHHAAASRRLFDGLGLTFWAAQPGAD
jgi:ATP/maltotriose-dependent transcriptional regulator MalT